MRRHQRWIPSASSRVRAAPPENGTGTCATGGTGATVTTGTCATCGTGTAVTTGTCAARGTGATVTTGTTVTCRAGDRLNAASRHHCASCPAGVRRGCCRGAGRAWGRASGGRLGLAASERPRGGPYPLAGQRGCCRGGATGLLRDFAAASRRPAWRRASARGLGPTVRPQAWVPPALRRRGFAAAWSRLSRLGLCRGSGLLGGVLRAASSAPWGSGWRRSS